MPIQFGSFQRPPDERISRSAHAESAALHNGQVCRDNDQRSFRALVRQRVSFGEQRFDQMDEYLTALRS
jgi:hypothetical protein